MTTKTYTVVRPEDYGEVIEEILSPTPADNSLVITLTGDLGAGKTTFVQQVGAQLGVSETIVSPTFTIMKRYQVENNRFEQLIHIDAYRIEQEDEVLPLGLPALIKEPASIVCIEWPEKIPSAILDQAVAVSIEINQDESRTVTISRSSVAK
jgi:tRNA threonylcarbamoyladenosine biosynthesis protein TsaE